MNVEFGRTGLTQPETGHGRFISRNHREAVRLGLNWFGPGRGLQRFVWNNPDFRGIPARDCLASTLEPYPTGIEPGQSLKLVGRFIVPRGLGAELFFVMSMGRDRKEEKPGSTGCILLDGSCILGSCESGMRFKNIIWQDMGDVGPEDFAWYEIQSDQLDLGNRTTVGIEIAFSVPDGTGNHYVAKIARELNDAHTFAEHLAPDLCLDDHLFVHPRRIVSGDPVLVSWAYNGSDSVTLNGEPVGNSGSDVFRPATSKEFVLAHGAGETRCKVTVEE